MTNIDVILMIVATSIGINYGLKLIGVFGQFKELKKKGETPLYGTVLLGFGLTLIIELVFSYYFTKGFFAYLDITYLSVWSFGTVLFLIKNVVAHYTAYGYWAVVVKNNEKKFKESLKRDIKKMGGEA